jgi:hypothetical protein
VISVPRLMSIRLALRVIGVLAVLVATGTMGLPRAWSEPALPRRQAPPRAAAKGAADLAPQGAPKAERGFAAGADLAPQGAPKAERGFAAGADLELARAKAQLRAAPSAPEARPASDRVVAPTHAAALFAQHTWYVLKPAPVPPPAPPPPPPPPPTAPPLPYSFVGSLSRESQTPVFFLARGDRVIDARVGDRLDGIYQLESAAGGQLVFLYLPLNVRQTLAAGASR